MDWFFRPAGAYPALFTPSPRVMSTTAAAMLSFPDHQPGDAYFLTREQFVRFAGLEDEYYACLEALKKVASARRGCCPNAFAHQPEQEAFWAAIAATEIRRRFWYDEGMLPSFVQMHELSLCKWEYHTTSDTIFRVIENRQMPEKTMNGEWNDTKPPEYFESKFIVIIPLYRDQPGRIHYESLRRGGTYRGLG